MGVALHVELSVPGPHPDVGVGGAAAGGGASVTGGAGAGGGASVTGGASVAGGVCVSPPPALSSAPLAVGANIPSIRIPATKIGKIIIIAIGLCTMFCKYDYNLIRLGSKGIRYRFSAIIVIIAIAMVMITVVRTRVSFYPLTQSAFPTIQR